MGTTIELMPHADLEEGGGATSEEELGRECRICHMSLVSCSSPAGSVSRVGIELGCCCKDDLAAAHKHCAETWFKIKGNKICEICNSTAQNVVGPDDITEGGEAAEHGGIERSNLGGSNSDNSSNYNSGGGDLMALNNSNAAAPSAFEREQIIGMMEKEMEYRVDMFNKLTHTCFSKCTENKYKESELNMGENSCIDRCVSKYWQVTNLVGQLLGNNQPPM